MRIEEEKFSPMMKHYLDMKKQYPDCVLLYRLGDFYEMFYDDAEKVSRMLDLTLTGKRCGQEKPAPMCGIPFHSVDGYIAKLVSLGEKVAICEQLSEPNKKGLVERDVIKIVTAGTLTETSLIDEKTNNFICSVFKIGNLIGLSKADITTGEFYSETLEGDNCDDDLLGELIKISPAEIICNKEAYDRFRGSPAVIQGVIPTFYQYMESFFDEKIASQTLTEQFGISDVSVLGLKSRQSVSSSGALISYLSETQKRILSNITEIITLNKSDFMTLDVSAVKNLELVKTLRDGKKYGSLLWVLDKTKTSMGARRLRSMILSPLIDEESINKRLDGVESLYENTSVRESVGEILTDIWDIGRLSGKISNGNLTPRDCIALKTSLESVAKLKFLLCGINCKIIAEIVDSLGDYADVVKLLGSAITENLPLSMKDGGYIKEGYSRTLDEYRSYRDNGKSVILDLEAKERERTGIKNLKISYNRVFGYYIELSNSVKNLAPYDYERRQTLTNAERFITPELKEIEDKIISGEQKSLSLESALYQDILSKLSKRIVDFKNTADAVSEIDVLTSLSKVARENGYVRPIIRPFGNPLVIKEGRHPVVERISQQRFVPNDALLDGNENRTMIITGPNMAGKSTYMRQNALIILLAHIGSFVPAKYAEIPLTDKIFTRIGANDNLISDQSTFMVEMIELTNILYNATKDSFVILDEIGRGTSTYDGLSIAWSVVEYVTKKLRAKTLFATHYHELTELEGKLDGVKNYKVTVKESPLGIVFLRKIMRGGANRSFGIEVAELAGVNHEVTSRAKQILKQLEKNDLNVNKSVASQMSDNDAESINNVSEVERIIKDVDVNSLSPVQAFNLLCDLQEKVKGNE